MFAPDNFHQSPPDYLKYSNDNIMIIVQIESRKAVENVEEIAAVDGIGELLSFSEEMQLMACKICCLLDLMI